MKLVGHRQIQGVMCDVFANPDGMWLIRYEDKDIGRGETIEQAINRARTALNKTRITVSVPLILKDGRKVKGTGFNLKTNGVLILIPGNDGLEEKDEISANEETFKLDTPPKVIKQYTDNVKLISEAREANRNTEREWFVKGSQMVAAAIEAVKKVQDAFNGLEESDRFNVAQNLIKEGVDMELVIQHANLSRVQDSAIRRANKVANLQLKRPATKQKTSTKSAYRRR